MPTLLLSEKQVFPQKKETKTKVTLIFDGILSAGMTPVRSHVHFWSNQNSLSNYET